MLRTRITTTSLGSLLCLSVAMLPTPAQAATDNTPPTLKTPIKSSFKVGSQVPLDGACFNEATEAKVFVSERFRWAGADDSGLVRYDVVEESRGEGPGDRLLNSTQTHLRVDNATNWTNDCGGGAFQPKGWLVTAKDATGNATTRFVGGGLIGLTQDDGLVDSPYGAPAAQPFYTGLWGVSSCDCWSNRTSHKTVVPGAAATIAVTVAADDADHVGLVMAKGPDRGKFKVYVDGVPQETVDTYAATSRPRVIVWQTALRAAGTHEVKIVNLATPGRPRIDLDAVLTN